MAGPVTKFVQGRRREFRRSVKGMRGRQLDVVGRRRVERSVTADPYDCSAVLQDDVGSFGAHPGRFLEPRRFVFRYPVNLRGMKRGIVFQEADRFPVVLSLAVLDLKGLAEKDCGRFLALLDVPVLFLSLLVGHPTRIAAVEGAYVHA